MQPAVSIITPTFNHARYIGPCIESVLAQGMSSWEQIVIDDGSTDGTGDLVARHADPRIRYLRQERVGLERLAETYNRALALCRAPLVAILEGDDLWPADKLETLLPAFADPAVVLAYGLTEVVGDVPHDFPPIIPSPEVEARFGRPALTNTPPGRAAAAMLDCRALTFTYPCSVVVRREALERIGGFQQPAGLIVTDYPTFLRLSLEGRFHFERRTTGYWRVHEAGATLRHMERLLRAVRREAERFHAAHGDRLGIARDEWREMQRAWRIAISLLALRQARRSLVARRWREARAPLAEALREGRLTTRAAALAGLAGSWLHFSVEPAYRWRGRDWFRREPSGEVATVSARKSP